MTMKELFKENPIMAIVVTLAFGCIFLISACTIDAMTFYRHAVNIHSSYCVNTNCHWVDVENSTCILDYDFDEE